MAKDFKVIGPLLFCKQCNKSVLLVFECIDLKSGQEFQYCLFIYLFIFYIRHVIYFLFSGR